MRVFRSAGAARVRLSAMGVAAAGAAWGAWPAVVLAAESGWKVDASGDWGTAANWSNGVPNGTADRATFPATITQPRTVNQNVVGLMLGRVDFYGTVPYTVSGGDIALNAAVGSPVLSSTSGTHTIASNLSLNGWPLFNGNPGTGLTLSGILSGTSGFVKSGANQTVTLTGTQSSSYNGSTQVASGTLRLAKTNNATAIPGGTLTIGSTSSGAPLATVELGNGGNLASGVGVAILENGRLDGGENFTVIFGGLAMTGGSIVNANLRLVNGNVTVHPAFNFSTISGSAGLDFFGQTRTFNTTLGSWLEISAPVNNGALTKSGDGTLVLSGANTYNGATTVGDGGQLRLDTSLTSSSSITLNDHARIELSPLGTRVVRTQNLSIPGTGRFDLRDNKLILTAQPVGSWNGSAYTDVSGLVDRGRGDAASAQWDGSGIVTSDGRATNNNDLASIGVARIGAIRNVADTATTTFAGQTVFGSATVAMVTWGGDANLDGKINILDYGQIDFNVGSSGSVFGWYNGDFNYDGKINILDYGIIDFNVGAQDSVFPTGGEVAAPVAVPEPGAAAAIAATLAGMSLARRRSRRP